MHGMPEYRLWNFGKLKITLPGIQIVTLKLVKDHPLFVCSEHVTPFMVPNNTTVAPTWSHL